MRELTPVEHAHEAVRLARRLRDHVKAAGGTKALVRARSMIDSAEGLVRMAGYRERRQADANSPPL